MFFEVIRFPGLCHRVTKAQDHWGWKSSSTFRTGTAGSRLSRTLYKNGFNFDLTYSVQSVGEEWIVWYRTHMWTIKKLYVNVEYKELINIQPLPFCMVVDNNLETGRFLATFRLVQKIKNGMGFCGWVQIYSCTKPKQLNTLHGTLLLWVLK